MNLKLTISLIAILFLGACGPGTEDEKGSGTKPKVEGPNRVAQRLVDAFNEGDIGEISELSTGAMRTYFVTLDKMGAILEEVVAFFEKTYPMEKDAPRLVKLRNSWHKPVEFYADLKLDGALDSEDASQERRYRISWSPSPEKRELDVMSVKLDGDVWRVESIGKRSPGTEMVANLRTQLSQLEFTYKAGMDAVKRLHPKTLMEAHFVFSKVRADMIERR